MSIIFGTVKPEGDLVSEQELSRMAIATQRYAADGLLMRAGGRIGMACQPYHTHQRSNLETKVAANLRGNMLAFDGRLDNYRELCDLLSMPAEEIPDSEIVLAAFERWDRDCFPRFVGDWALALWSDEDRSLYLARDHAGTRKLYFERTAETIIWSTSLETLLANGETREVDKVYAARYLSCSPIREHTPYKGVSSVLPAHCCILRSGRIECYPHWKSVTKNRVHYSTDRDYEDHFMSLLRQAVERRTGPGAAILAQLSGGMDSSSILCVADQISNKRGSPAEDLLDTVSFFDNSEPTWNEYPYFTAVERMRRKQGVHVELSMRQRTFAPYRLDSAKYLFPGADSSSINQEERFNVAVAERPYRVILSGVGGDEVLGGVPTPTPELADYLTRGDFPALCRQTIAWCLAKRTTFGHELCRALKMSYQASRNETHFTTTHPAPPWLIFSQDTAGVDTVAELRQRTLPSGASNRSAWWSIMETLSGFVPEYLHRREYRYPLLDRDLVDFLFAIPRHQILRPGERRSLMRRSLSSILPPEILKRTRKGYQFRSPILAVRDARPTLQTLFGQPMLSEICSIDGNLLLNIIDAIESEKNTLWWPFVMRTICYEIWLKSNFGGTWRCDA